MVLPDEMVNKSKSLHRLPLKKLAEIRKLPPQLSIANIVELCVDDKQERLILLNYLIDACRNNELTYYGDIKGWEWGGGEFNYIANLYPDVRGVQVDMGDPMRTAVYNRYKALPKRHVRL